MKTDGQKCKEAQANFNPNKLMLKEIEKRLKDKKKYKMVVEGKPENGMSGVALNLPIEW